MPTSLNQRNASVQGSTMISLRSSVAAALLLLNLPSCATAPPSVAIQPVAAEEAKSGYVFVDQSNPAYTLFLGIPEGTAPQKLAELRSQASKQSAVIVQWDQFHREMNQYARTKILRNDYPQYNVVDGIMCLVHASPGAPWGLVWNGGIALTAADYARATSLFDSYQRNPTGYRPQSDPRGDRLNPGGFLPLYGCLQ